MSHHVVYDPSLDAPFESNPGDTNFWDADNIFNSLPPLQFNAATALAPMEQQAAGLFPVPVPVQVQAVHPGTSGASVEPGKFAAHEQDGSKPSTSGKSGKNEGKGSDDTTSEHALEIKRKKALIASRTNREKRKRQIYELRERNAELFKERAEFRKIVADLQLQVQANREAGKIDLETENELLRAELGEHKAFIAQFKSITDGTPVSNAQKHLAALQGAKSANAQVLGVLHTSAVDPSWKKGYSRLHPELSIMYQRLPIGSTSKSASRIALRVDFPLVKAPLHLLHDIQWRAWSDSDLSSRLSSHFGQVQTKEIKEIDLNLDDLKCGPDTNVKVYYYREERLRRRRDDASTSKEESKDVEQTDSVDTIFLITSKKQNLPFSVMPTEGAGQAQQSQTKSDPTVYPSIVMATTSTKHSNDIVSAKPGVHRIESALLEGIVLRQIEVDETYCTWVASYPLNNASEEAASDFLSASSAQGWIDDDGYFTAAAEQAGNDLMRIHAENLDPVTAQEYLVRAMQAAVEAAKKSP